MAGYKTVKTWSAPDIEFDIYGRRIFPRPDLLTAAGFELCRSPLSADGGCLKRCGEKCEWGGKG